MMDALHGCFVVLLVCFNASGAVALGAGGLF
jgi:hypothetical protein